MQGGLPAHNVAPNQGKMLQIVAEMCKASRILEIGTLAGYSTIWMARAIDGLPGAKLISLEVNPNNAAIAQKNINHAGLDHIVEIRVGAAIETLKSLVASDEKFDLIFIDADKPNNPHYIKYALQLSRKGTVIIADNVVRDGKVANPASTDANVIGVKSYFDILSESQITSSTAVQTVGCKGWDGFCLTLVTQDPARS
jgi:predicted O-methyltransferase YrrM